MTTIGPQDDSDWALGLQRMRKLNSSIPLPKTRNRNRKKKVKPFCTIYSRAIGAGVSILLTMIRIKNRPVSAQKVQFGLVDQGLQREIPFIDSPDYA